VEWAVCTKKLLPQIAQISLRNLCNLWLYPSVQRSISFLLYFVLISLGILFFRLGSLPLTGADEPRYARIAQEMHEHGAWITPTLEGKPWLEKPPLYYWITIPCYSLFDIPETAARVGSAVCAFIAAVSILFLGSALGTRLAGMIGSLILLTSLGFAGFGRSASTDMPFTCVFTISMAILAVALERDIGWKVLSAYVFLGLAVLGKGPVAVVLMAGTGLCFWLLDERGIIPRRWRLLPGLLLATAVSIPWFWLVFRQNGYAFLSTFFINHNLARYITDVHHHSEPVYYFFLVLIALFFPWSGWLLMLASKSPLNALRRWRQWDSRLVFLVCWFLFPIIFFSLSESKLPGYILPSFPPLALILGIHLSRWIEQSVEPPWMRAGVVLQLLLSIGMAIVAPVYFHKEYGGNFKIGLCISIAALIPAVFALGYGIKGNCRNAFRATVIQSLAILMAVLFFALPVLGAYHSTRDIAQQALLLRRTGETISTFRFFHHSLYYYSSYQIANEFSSPEELGRALQTRHSFLVVTNIKGYQTLSESKNLAITRLSIQGNFLLLRVLESSSL
jgi:4-amino-4-deoxy-L-arabinose transferase-like glycosyltransferase